MSDGNTQGNLVILTDMIIKKLNEDAVKDAPRPTDQAKLAKHNAALQESETMIRAAAALIGGALVDLRRIASALESLALSHLPKPPQ